MHRSLLAILVVVAATVATGCAITQPASEVGDTSATLSATVNPFGTPTEYWFQYGPTTSYGSQTPRRDGGAGSASSFRSERVTGLSPDTLYHYRACYSNATKSDCGNDLTFRTGSAGMLPGFQETTAFSGLTQPTAVRFSPDGRVFVAEKSGLIKVFDGLGDTTPDHLRRPAHPGAQLLGSRAARPRPRPGLPGGAVRLRRLHPRRPDRRHRAALGVARRVGRRCPNPPGATGDGCVVSGRVSRLRAQENQAIGDEQVLIEDWCQQYPSHSVGDVGFGADGALYVSGGDGASFNFMDYGQDGSPVNPCGDPPAGVGGAMTPPDAEGGALRSQDVRTSDDPAGLDGAIIRVDKETGEALPGNPFAASDDPDARRIVAYGLRNPFRFAIRPGTSEPWVGDVGWGHWEEINRVANPADSTAGELRLALLRGNRAPGQLRLRRPEPLREPVPAAAVTSPHYTYNHSDKVVAERDVPRRELLDLRAGLQPARQHPARRLRRRALLRRLLAQLHLGHAARRRARCPASASRDLPRRRGGPGRPRVRARQRPLLSRLRHRAGSGASTTPRATRHRGRSPPRA